MNDRPIGSSSKTPPRLSPQELLSADSSTLTPSLIRLSLTQLDDLYAALATCANLILSSRLDPPHLVDAVIQFGLDQCQGKISFLEDHVRSSLSLSPNESWNAVDKGQGQVANLIDEWAGVDEQRQDLLKYLAVLKQAQHRLETYQAMAPPSSPLDSNSVITLPVEEDADDIAIQVDDPWAEMNNEMQVAEAEEDEVPELDDPWESNSDQHSIPIKDADTLPKIHPPVPLSIFLVQPLLTSALAIAASAHLSSLRKLCERHREELFPFRLTILDALPGWVSPADHDILVLLPGLNEDGTERPWPQTKTNSTSRSQKFSILDFIPSKFFIETSTLPRSDSTRPLLSPDLSKWYADRVFSLDELGLIDAQLAWIQHGAALGASGLDALGEDLSLLSRLVYDAHLSPAQLTKWSISSWQAASEIDVVHAYISASTPQTIVGDLRRLVLPYLYVLESRAERAGKADPGIVQRMMYDAILDLPLPLALPCFEASKATEPQHTRLIKNDQDVARLALACLYGSDQLNVWSTMSAIFECLPVWDVSGGDLDSDREATSTTLDSIATFVKPTVLGPVPTSKDLFLFFHPLPFASLSRALDILDVHLESGEILARWETPVRLQFLLQTARDREGQLTLAERMVRRQSSRGGDDRRWIGLWDDMRKLNGGNDSLLRGAFGVLTIEDLLKVFLGGLLSSGNFTVAAKVIKRLEPESYFTPKLLQQVVLDKAREFYERAETANIHTGDMKLAYDCPSRPAIKAEKELIEATSRLTTFRSLSSLTPAEIRHCSNRLDLIRRVLSTSDDAFKHDEIIMSLVDGLGYRSDPAARAEVVGMLADAAIQAAEWRIAAEKCAELVEMAQKVRKDQGEKVKKRIEDVTWKTCLALGRREEWNDPKGRMNILAFALAFCPPDSVRSVLPLWRRAEDQTFALGDESSPFIYSSFTPTTASNVDVGNDTRRRGLGLATSLARGAEQRVLGSRTAARAAQLARDLSSSFKLRSISGSRGTSGIHSVIGNGEKSPAMAFDKWGGESEAERVGDHARRALVKGVGWLLGADEHEIN